MKHFKIISTFLLLAILTDACGQNNSQSQTGNAAPLVGNWKVSSYMQNGNDLTNQFNGYNFYCNQNGRMAIKGNGFNYDNCWWNNFDDCCMNNSRYSKNSMFHFHMMDCDDNSFLWNLQEDWDLTKYDNNNLYFSCHNPNRHCTMTWIRAK